MADKNKKYWDEFKSELYNAVEDVFYNYNGTKGCSYGKSDLDKALSNFWENSDVEEGEISSFDDASDEDLDKFSKVFGEFF